MDIYELIYESFRTKLENNEITLEVAEKVNDLAYEKYVVEAEEDHRYHVAYKNLASKKLNKDEKDMPNKKYIKDPKKADLHYKGREELIKKDLKENKGNDYVRKKPFDNLIHGGIDDNGYDRYFHDIEVADKGTAVKALEYMKKHANPKDRKEFKKYRLAFKIFCQRFNIDENSSLWIKYNPGNEINFGGKIGKVKTEDRMTIGAYTDRGSVKVDKEKDTETKKHLFKKNEVSLKLPNGYKLYHKTDKDGLKQLEPVIRSTKYITGGPSGNAGQYHPTGRIYFTVEKSSANLDKSYGDHVYELISPISEVFLDSEHALHFVAEDLSNLNFDKLVGKPVFIKTNRPLKVKQIK